MCHQKYNTAIFKSCRESWILIYISETSEKFISRTPSHPVILSEMLSEGPDTRKGWISLKTLTMLPCWKYGPYLMRKILSGGKVHPKEMTTLCECFIMYSQKQKNKKRIGFSDKLKSQLVDERTKVNPTKISPTNTMYLD